MPAERRRWRWSARAEAEGIDQAGEHVAQDAFFAISDVAVELCASAVDKVTYWRTGGIGRFRTRTGLELTIVVVDFGRAT